jgi:hypothetical protein
MRNYFKWLFNKRVFYSWSFFTVFTIGDLIFKDDPTNDLCVLIGITLATVYFYAEEKKKND